MKQARERLGRRREEVAAKAEISFEYVRRLESEDPPTPGLDVARRIAEALDSSVDDLFPAPEPLHAEAK